MLRNLQQGDLSGPATMSTAARTCSHLAVGEAAVLQDLQQHVEHIGVRLLDFVKQHQPRRPPPHRLRQAAALAETDEACRQVDENNPSWFGGPLRKEVQARLDHVLACSLHCFRLQSSSHSNTQD